MNRRVQALSGPPTKLKRARLDNITLVPASLLPFKKRWQQLAGELPAREALFVVPEGETPLRQTMRRLVPQLRASGRHVTALSAKQLT